MHTEQDIASCTMNILAMTNTWILVRHQWLISKMRSILTGEAASPEETLIQFDQAINHLKLPENLTEYFTDTKRDLELAWSETAKTYHPLSGLSIFDQLNFFQSNAHHFMDKAKELNQKLWQEFTMRDPLTGALSRLTLNACISAEISRCQRYHHISTIALLDQEKFKEVNDQWGHHMGDKVLANTARLIQKNLRKCDKLFRYGGDEWLILMPDSSQAEAKNLLKRIKKITDEYQYSTLNHKVFYSSFHYGLAECSQHSSVEEWIAAADNNLYDTKNRFSIL